MLWNRVGIAGREEEARLLLLTGKLKVLRRFSYGV